MADGAIKLGDVVVLKSGGPPMSVDKLLDNGAHCFWFDEKNARQSSVFGLHLLTPHRPVPPQSGGWGNSTHT